MEQHQKELATEFEARFPALYRKSQAMRSASAMEEPASPPPGSPPPPFRSEPLEGLRLRSVGWTGVEKDDDGNFELRKAPLVEHFATGLDMMRAAGDLTPGSSGSTPQGYGLTATDRHGKGRVDLYADDYDADYDEIDPPSEDLGNDLGFREAGVSGAGSGSGESTQDKKRVEDIFSDKKAAKKRPQIWDRLRTGGSK